MIAETMAIEVNRRYLKPPKLPGINSDEPQLVLTHLLSTTRAIIDSPCAM
jgi:hypothetical protein